MSDTKQSRVKEAPVDILAVESNEPLKNTAFSFCQIGQNKYGVFKITFDALTGKVGKVEKIDEHTSLYEAKTAFKVNVGRTLME